MAVPLFQQMALGIQLVCHLAVKRRHGIKNNWRDLLKIFFPTEISHKKIKVY